MRLPSAIRTFDPAFFDQSPGRLDGVPMLGRRLLANHRYGALKGSLGVTPCLLGAGHTGGDLGLVPLVQARIGWLPAGFSLCVIRISNDRLLEPCSDCTLGNPTSCVRTKHNALTCGSSWWARKARITLPLQQLPAPRNGTFMRALRAHMPNSSLPSGLQTRAR